MVIYTQRKKSLHGDSDTNYILLKRDLRPQEWAGVSNASGYDSMMGFCEHQY